MYTDESHSSLLPELCCRAWGSCTRSLSVYDYVVYTAYVLVRIARTHAILRTDVDTFKGSLRIKSTIVHVIKSVGAAQNALDDCLAEARAGELQPPQTTLGPRTTTM
eukprot:2028719-Prymnesium_polylepis.2